MSNLKEKSVMFVKPYVNKGLDRSRSIQIPFKAHTSTNAKVGILASLAISTVALLGVTALIGHGIAKRLNPEYGSMVDTKIRRLSKQTKDKLDEASKDSEDIAEKGKKR